MAQEHASDYQLPRNGWRTFLMLWITQSLSEFGTQVTLFTMTIWMTQVLFARPDQRGNLALALAAEGIAFGVAGLLAAPIAGAWADRHDRKRIILITNVASGCVTLLLMRLLIFGELQLWMWIAIAVCLSALSSFHTAAFNSSYVMLLPGEQLPRASAMTQTALSFSIILSPGFAAALITLPALLRRGSGPGATPGWPATLHDGASLAVAIDAVTYIIAALAAALLVIPSPGREELSDTSGQVKGSIWADMLEGAQYIRRRPPLLWLMSLFTVANLLLFPSVLLPLVVKFDLADDWTARGFTFEAAMALLGTTVGIAGVIWGGLISIWGGLKRRRVYAVLLPLLVAGLAQVGMGLSPWLYFTAAMAFILIGMGSLMGAHMAAIWQTQTPREMQGRVFAMRQVIARFGGPLGLVLSGVGAGIFDPGALMAVMGGLIVLYCVAQLFNPRLLRVEDRDHLEAMAARSGDAGLSSESSPAGE